MSHTDSVLDECPVRCSRKQKTAFIRYMDDLCRREGWPLLAERSGLTVNLIAGDLAGAKVVFACRYDTPIRRLFPWTVFPESRILTLFSRYAPVLCSTVLLLVAALLLKSALAFAIVSNAWLLFVLFFSLRLVAGPACEDGYQHGTSGMLTLLVLMRVLNRNNRSKVAFLFFEDQPFRLTGGEKFSWFHKRELRGKPVLFLDCVSRGSRFFTFCGSRRADGPAYAALTEQLKRHAVRYGKTVVPAPMGRRSWNADYKFFPGGIGICCGAPLRLFGYGFPGPGAPKEEKPDPDNLTVLAGALRAYVENLP